MGISEKKLKFVNEFLEDGNATRAAIAAGYSKKTAKSQGNRLLTKADVIAEIARRRKKREKKTDVTVEWVLKRQVEVVERCMQIEPVLDKEGNEIGEYKFDSTGANSGLKLLAKHLGMDRVNVAVEAGGLGLVLHMAGKKEKPDE